jgi:hypothetical protein
MANRNFNRLQALEKEVKKLYVKISTDGSGDVTAIDGLGVESVSHSSDVYTITLQDKYNSFKAISAMSSVAANFTVDASSFSSKEIDLEASVTQASTDIYVEISVKNTNIK